MALDKQSVSINLTQGADTKVNSQIDKDFQEMVNINFVGDTTAKKMDGYDLLQTLPAGEKFSLIASRENDLICQTDKGTYKYQQKFSSFKKISNIGASDVVSAASGGYNFSFSTNYRCVANFINGYIYFYDHRNILINSSTFSYMTNILINNDYKQNLSKVISNGDDFYICSSFTSSDYGVNRQIAIQKFVLNGTTSEFESSATWRVDTGATAVEGVDFLCDGTNIFVGRCGVFNGIFYKLSLALVLALTVPYGTSLASNMELFNYDATYFLASSLRLQSAGVYNHLLIKIRKSDLVATVETTIRAAIAAAGDGSGGFYLPLNTTYPLTSTTAISLITQKAAIAGGLLKFRPIGRIFLRNGVYYIPVLHHCGTSVSTVVMSISFSSLTGYYEIDTPKGISNTFTVTTLYLPVFYTAAEYPFVLNELVSYSNIDYFPSIAAGELINETRPVMIGFNINESIPTKYIEIGKSLIISGGITSYIDGYMSTEYGFIGNPYIPPNAISFSVGTLPIDTAYQVAILYSWKDILGNVFYSSVQYTNTFDITLANYSIRVLFQLCLITVKQNITCEIYVRRKNKLFQLCSSFIITPSITSYDPLWYIVTIDAYPASIAKVMPYQDGTVPIETVSNSFYSSLYADRIFRISKDYPISLGYSQKKLSYEGFEFNDSFLFLDIIDKRGINEDELSGIIALDGRLIIFKQYSILYMVGSGPSRANTQDDFSDPLLISSDVGCITPLSIVLTPDGIMFKSEKGIYLLDRQLNISYIGSAVELFNSRTITSAILVEKNNEIRFATLEGEILVYNYYSKAWSWFLNLPSISSCIHNGIYTLLLTSGKVYTESSIHNKIVEGAVHTAIVQKISTPWLRVDKEQGWSKIYKTLILGVYKSQHKIKLEVYYDYESYISETYLLQPLSSSQYNIVSRPTDTQLQDGTKINGIYQMIIDMIRKNCTAFRIVITDVPEDVANNTGECFALSNITVTVGLKKGPAKLPASKSY